MVSHSVEAASTDLGKSLKDALQALARLHAAVMRLQPLEGGSSPGCPAFSTSELHRLRAVIRHGGAAILRRLKKLSGATQDPAPRVAEFWRVDSTGSPENTPAEKGAEEPPSRSLLATYRSTCRALCGSLQEAQSASDMATAVLLHGLLQRLEKQLWLLDYSRERIRVGLPTIDLFLSC